MDDNFLKEQREKLIKEKDSLVEQLNSFSTPDKELKGDWDTKYPTMSENESGNAGEGSLDVEADELEQYESNISIEHTLETRLQKVNKAIQSIEEKKYGICEKCNEPISKERLEVVPEATTCNKCK